ncbi:HepT-like ribonuclease domain-containing protein [Caballeronia novacaledonica]|nr:HepT-like ribonuclease domain-containing protein [Caballeronia novacaledonica]
MRNALSHGYHKIDFGVVWVTVREDLPALGKQFESLAAELSDAN